MADIKKILKNDEGVALVLSLLILVVLSLLGTVGLLTSGMELKISGNEKHEKIAFYYAEAGLNEAIALIDSGDIDDSTTNQETDPNWGVSSAAMAGITGMSGFYSYSVIHKLEDAAADSSHCDDDNNDGALASPAATDCNGEVVFYNRSGFGYGANAAITGDRTDSQGFGQPVYKVSVIGRSGTSEVNLSTEVTKNTLNLNTPGGLYASSATGNGNYNVTGNVVTVNNISSNFNFTNGTSTTVAPIDMTSYLGIDIDDFEDYADEKYYGASGNFNTEASDWDSASTDVNSPLLIYIDNDTAGEIQITGNYEIWGAVILTGDFRIGGTLTVHGLLYIMGDLQGGGTVIADGGVMVNDSSNFGGNVNVTENQDMLTTLGKNSFGSKTVSWRRVY